MGKQTFFIDGGRLSGVVQNIVMEGLRVGAF